MRIRNKKPKIKTGKGLNFIDITDELKLAAKESRIHDGSLNIFVRHTTAGVRVNENEERLLEDMHMFFERIAPKNAKYLHDDIHLRDCPPDERLNGHAHMKSLVLNTTEHVPIVDSELVLGTWQRVFFVELDGSRDREVLVQIMGDGDEKKQPE
jgi:secondary thiamine-phosphate synthase enzyme